MLILKQCHCRTILLLLKHFLLTTIKCQLKDQPQNIVWDLVTCVKNIMSQIRTLMMHHLKINQKTHQTIDISVFVKVSWSFRNNGFMIEILTDGATFPAALIKREKLESIKK